MGSAFDRVADRYAYGDDVLGTRVRRAVLRSIQDRLPRGATILDVGAGTGDYALALAAAGYDVTALDVEPKMLARIEQRAADAGLELRTLHHDIRAPLPNAQYDAVLTISGPLNYVADPKPLVANLAGAVSRGGRVWLGLSRGAFVPYVLRHPRGLARSLLGRAAHVRGAVGGQPIDLHLWDPRAFAREVSPWLEIESVRALVLAPRLPEALDLALGRRPGLRRLGAVSLLEGRPT